MLPFTLQQLRILKAIAAEKNFTKAAAVLYLSQPALSKQIRRLEKNLNTFLISRERNQISLTESGKVLLHYSNRILALSEESCRAVIDLRNCQRGNLMIGASQTIGIYLMPRILGLFTQNFPEVDLSLQVYSTGIIAKKIINREIDIAIVDGEIATDLKKNLTIQSFVFDELNLIISKSHPFGKKEKITKKDLYSLDFISLNSNSTTKKCIDNTLIQNEIETEQLRTIFQLDSIEAIKTAVGLGWGVAFVSSLAIEKEIKLQTIRILKIENLEVQRKLIIITNPNSPKSKAFKAFYNQLQRLKFRIEN